MKVRFTERPAGGETMSPDLRYAGNYYQWIVSCLTPYMGQRILDIGGGFGAHLEHILLHCEQVTSIDLSHSAVALMQDKFKDYLHFQALQVDFGANDDANQQLRQHAFDTVTALDVIEHIEDDYSALQHIYSLLAPQRGILFIKVPAHPWLYGSLDHQAGHYRRYSKASMRQLLQASHFETLELYYFNSFGVLPWYLNAVVLQQDIASQGIGTQIQVFNKYIVPVIRPLERRFHPPVGQSLIAIARANPPQRTNQ